MKAKIAHNKPPPAGPFLLLAVALTILGATQAAEETFPLDPKVKEELRQIKSHAASLRNQNRNQASILPGYITSDGEFWSLPPGMKETDTFLYDDESGEIIGFLKTIHHKDTYDTHMAHDLMGKMVADLEEALEPPDFLFDPVDWFSGGLVGLVKGTGIGIVRSGIQNAAREVTATTAADQTIIGVSKVVLAPKVKTGLRALLASLRGIEVNPGMFIRFADHGVERMITERVTMAEIGNALLKPPAFRQPDGALVFLDKATRNRHFVLVLGKKGIVTVHKLYERGLQGFMRNYQWTPL